MAVRFPFRNLIPTFFAGLLDDPVLLLRTRPNGRHLLFDCGQIHHLAKRTFTNLDAIFISHAHMDHWMGIDSVIRQLIAAGKTVDIYGGPGIADRFEHKLLGYAWNLAEDYWSSFQVHEVHSDRISCELFAGAESFARQTLPSVERSGRIIYQNKYLDVLSVSCDHRVASLTYRINERPNYVIDKDKLAEARLLPGPWLSELKRCFLNRQALPERLTLYIKDGERSRETIIEDVPGLMTSLCKPRPIHAIGYLSDVGYTTENRQKILELMQGVDLLLCECTFLADAKERARASWHLCTADVNELLSELRPGYFLPMHLSRSYSRCSEQLYRELQVPAGTALLKLPLHLTPRPLLANEVDWQVY